MSLPDRALVEWNPALYKLGVYHQPTPPRTTIAPRDPHAKHRKVGRPSSYNEETARRICELLVNGQSMIEICRLPGMPSRMTVMRWLEEHPDFDANHARARKLQAEYMDDLIMLTAKNSTPETASADKVKLGAYQWRAERLNSGKYAPKPAQMNLNSAGGSINVNLLPEDKDTI